MLIVWINEVAVLVEIAVVVFDTVFSEYPYCIQVVPLWCEWRLSRNWIYAEWKIGYSHATPKVFDITKTTNVLCTPNNS